MFTGLDEIQRSKRLEKWFEQELGSALLSSVSKPKLASLEYIHNYIQLTFLLE